MEENFFLVKHLKINLRQNAKTVHAVDDISFKIHPGETFCLVGESGAGKSVVSQSILQLLDNAEYGYASSIQLNEKSLLDLSQVELRKIRGKNISIIFQEPMTSLNPVLTIGQQLEEAILKHSPLNKQQVYEKSIQLLSAVGISDQAMRLDQYPHQLSGGMKQRVMIAMAISGNPDLLIADEPTTALDVTIQAQVLNVLNDLKQHHKMAILMVTHDLAIVFQMADTVAVMYAGQIVEQASREVFFKNPRHPYSQKLLACIPNEHAKSEPLETIPGILPDLTQPVQGCRFASRCSFKWSLCEVQAPELLPFERTAVRCHLYTDSAHIDAEKIDKVVPTLARRKLNSQELISIKDLKVYYPQKKTFFNKPQESIKAVDGISLSLKTGRTLAIVGESGCGKTSIANALLKLIPNVEGEVTFHGMNLSQVHGKDLRTWRRYMQMIFQDPMNSLNPRMLIRDIISEGLDAQGLFVTPKHRLRRLKELLEQVGLPENSLDRYPHEFSGGQRQRIAIARALAVEPQLLICDEPTSALDVSVQAQIINLLKRLQAEKSLAYIFISHNIAVVSYLADQIAVMYLGRVVEYGDAATILRSPQHPYTQALLASVPQIGKIIEKKPAMELPSPLHPPHGCHYHPRCPFVMERCRTHVPDLYSMEGVQVRCFLYGG